MTTNFRRRLKTMETCRHESVTKTVNAGIGRSVCNQCGHVSVEFSKSNVPADAVYKEPVAV